MRPMVPAFAAKPQSLQKNNGRADGNDGWLFSKPELEQACRRAMHGPPGTAVLRAERFRAQISFRSPPFTVARTFKLGKGQCLAGRRPMFVCGVRRRWFLLSCLWMLPCRKP